VANGKSPINRTLLYLVILALVASVAVGANSIIYANGVGRRSERHAEELNAKTDKEVRNFCTLLRTLDSAYNGTVKPTTDLGRTVAKNVGDLRQALCG
jgi:hypothetical protein